MKLQLKLFLHTIALLTWVWISSQQNAIAEAQLSPDQVVALVNSVPEGESVSRKLSIELIDRRGQKRRRETMSCRKQYDGVKKTVIFFLSPANVKDTGFLIWDYADAEKDDDQWLYLPALGKVRRVSSADRGDYFLGTDFTYEDLKLDGKLSLTDYNYSFNQDNGPSNAFIKLDAIPKTEAIAKELGYSKTTVKIDPSNWIVMEVDFWDTKGSPFKQLRATDIRKVDGIWTRHTISMQNHQTEHRTVLEFSEVNYESKLKDDFFTKQSLTRGY
jgi:hypothetical protein